MFFAANTSKKVRSDQIHILWHPNICLTCLVHPLRSMNENLIETWLLDLDVTWWWRYRKRVEVKQFVLLVQMQCFGPDHCLINQQNSNLNMWPAVLIILQPWSVCVFGITSSRCFRSLSLNSCHSCSQPRSASHERTPTGVKLEALSDTMSRCLLTADGFRAETEETEFGFHIQQNEVPLMRRNSICSWWDTCWDNDSTQTLLIKHI